MQCTSLWELAHYFSEQNFCNLATWKVTSDFKIKQEIIDDVVALFFEPSDEVNYYVKNREITKKFNYSTLTKYSAAHLRFLLEKNIYRSKKYNIAIRFKKIKI